MSLSTVNYQGFSDAEVLNSVLYKEEILQHHIDNISRVLNEKQYYGLNISFVDLTYENLEAHKIFLSRLYARLKEEGFIVMVTISPRIVVSSNAVSFEALDYSEFGRMTDYLMILSYAWKPLQDRHPHPHLLIYQRACWKMLLELYHLKNFLQVYLLLDMIGKVRIYLAYPEPIL